MTDSNFHWCKLHDVEMQPIDADALKEDYRMADDCKDCKTGWRSCQCDNTYTKMNFCGWLDDAPTVEAVPVVRCKDCRWWDDAAENCGRPKVSLKVKAADFCSFRKKK